VAEPVQADQFHVGTGGGFGGGVRGETRAAEQQQLGRLLDAGRLPAVAGSRIRRVAIRV